MMLNHGFTHTSCKKVMIHVILINKLFVILIHAKNDLERVFGINSTIEISSWFCMITALVVPIVSAIFVIPIHSQG